MTPSETTDIDLGGGASANVNDERLLVNLPSHYTALSSAVMNGGLVGSITNNSSSTDNDGDDKEKSIRHVINCRVPPTYDGYHPSPRELLRKLSSSDGIDYKRTCGLLTAASMKSLATSHREIRGVRVSVLTTAGISNARCIGADADFFGGFGEEDEQRDNDNSSNNNDNKPTSVFGTINTIVIVNTPFSSLEAMMECYATIIEAKCAACNYTGIVCRKNPSTSAQGTGTDCAVLVCPALSSSCETSQNQQQHMQRCIPFSGKHVLFGEMMGQAVREATESSLAENITHIYGNIRWYTVCRWTRAVLFVLGGTRPCVPPRPMMPMPRLPVSVAMTGISAVVVVYVSSMMPHRTKFLLAAFAWDRWLGEPPLVIHPVVIAGRIIKAVVDRVPTTVLESPTLGTLSGMMLLTAMILLFGCASLRLINIQPTTCCSFADFPFWIVRVVLLKSTFSIQLLCTVAMQMARFLERRQIEEARIQLCWLCSRDSSSLDEEELAAGTIESLGENLSDGFVGPLFWYCALGPVGALLYRIINTLDSTIGYRGKFEWFGKPSAITDDIVNIIPARLTALFLLLASKISGVGDPNRGWRVLRTDGRLTASPNAGVPMSCCAGLLGVKLEKPKEYTLNREGSTPNHSSIKLLHRIAHLASAIALFVACMVVWIQ